MLRKLLLAVALLIPPAVTLGLPAQAKALSYVEWHNHRSVPEFMVQFRCPQTGQWRDYRPCTTNAHIQNAISELTLQRYTVRYILVRERNFFWVYPASAPSREWGRWVEFQAVDGVWRPVR
jgi:hypothetical protein